MSQLIIDALSDTHNRHKEFVCRGGDILMHTGDMTSHGSMGEAISFLDWYGAQNYTHKLLIAGNHDWIFEKQPELMADECRSRGIILLNDSGAILKDMENEYLIRVWGSPVQPWFHSWAFNRQRGPDIKKHWDLIPKNTEMLLTHGPPHGIGSLDVVTYANGTPKERVGCWDLSDRLAQTDVLLHVFGHIHEGRGVEYVGDRTYINASSLDRMYCPVDRKPIRIIREVFQDGSIGYVA